MKNNIIIFIWAFGLIFVFAYINLFCPKVLKAKVKANQIIYYADSNYSSWSRMKTKAWVETLKQAGHPAQETIKVVDPLPESILPPDMASAAFVWKDPAHPIHCSAWLVSFDCKQGPLLRARLEKSWWIPGAEVWEKLKELAGQQKIKVTIQGVGGWYGREIVSTGQTSFQFSKDKLGARIMYMQKPLPFALAKDNPDLTTLLAGDLSSYEPPAPIMQNQPVCANCHTYSRSGTTMAMDMDFKGDKGSFVLSPMQAKTLIKARDIHSWNTLPPQKPATYSMGLFASLSPDGRFLAGTVNETSVFVMLDDLYFSQLFFPATGQIAWFDSKTNQFSLLPGASRPDLVQTSPAWSPDGRTLAFAATEVDSDLVLKVKAKEILQESHAQKIRTLNKKYPVQFDIFTLPFNQGKGGKAKPLPGASNNGYSNYFPRYSPDGKWVVFTQSPTGLVLQPESRLCIVPAQGGQARILKCNMPVMNSWHSWSPNSKWLVFTCKARSPYTQLFLTHIDDTGRSSPAVHLFRFSSQDLAAMVPEFIPKSATVPENFGLADPENALGESMAVDGR